METVTDTLSSGWGWMKELISSDNELDRQAKQLIDEAFSDITSPVIDYHTHLVSNGTSPASSASGCCVHEHLTQPLLHPLRGVQFKVYCSAAGITDSTVFDIQYIDRLVGLIKDMPMGRWGKHYLLAFDRWYDKNGKSDPNRTGFYVSNEYMSKIVELNPDHFLPCISVHPYRKDALTELEKYAAQGVKMVKWLPNSMGMDPSDPLCIPFYKKCVELKMVLLTHTGEEHSVNPPGSDNSLGNPLLLRAALDQGVMVIAAHCASEGYAIDLDSPKKKNVSCYRLLLRLMDDPKYNKLLFADISAIIGFLRLGDPLTTMLDRIDLHSRLLFGSDYPVPAISFVVQTGAMVVQGYLSSEERNVLNHVYEKNPLLFDYLCKRLVRSPNTGNKFSASIFMANPRLSYDAL